MTHLRLWAAVVVKPKVPSRLQDDDQVASSVLAVAVADAGDTLAIVLVEQLLGRENLVHTAEKGDELGGLASHVVNLQLLLFDELMVQVDLPVLEPFDPLSLSVQRIELDVEHELSWMLSRAVHRLALNSPSERPSISSVALWVSPVPIT